MCKENRETIREAYEALGEDRELFTEVAQEYIDDVPRQVQRLYEAVASADRYKLSGIAHSVKSASATIGANESADCARRLEHAASTVSWERLQKRVQTLKECMESAVACLMHFVSE